MGQRCRYVLQALLGLLCQVVGNGHGGIVKTCGAGDEDPVPLDHSPAVGNLCFEGGARADELTFHTGATSLQIRNRRPSQMFSLLETGPINRQEKLRIGLMLEASATVQKLCSAAVAKLGHR